MAKRRPRTLGTPARNAGVLIAIIAVIAGCGGSGPADATPPSPSPGRTSGAFADETPQPGETDGAPQSSSAGPRNLSGTLDPVFVGGLAVTGLATDGQTVWATDRERDVVVAVDLATGRVTGEYDVGGAPLGIAYADGELWVANSSAGAHSVSRLDAATGETIATIVLAPGRSPSGIAVADGAVWVATSGSGELVRIGSVSGDVEATIADQSISAAGTIDVLVAFDSIWTIDNLSGSVLRIDPAANAISDRYSNLGFVNGGVRGPLRLAADANRIWVLSTIDRGRDATGLYTIDPDAGTADLSAEFAVPPDARGLPGLLIDSEGGAWFSVDERLLRFALAERRADTIENDLAIRFTAFLEAGGRVWYGLSSSFDEDLTGLYGVELARILAS